MDNCLTRMCKDDDESDELSTCSSAFPKIQDLFKMKKLSPKLLSNEEETEEEIID